MPKAGRIYLQLDVNYYEDAKVSILSPLAELLYVRCLCACKRLLTDGVLLSQQMRRIGVDLCDEAWGHDLNSLTHELIAAGLLVGDVDAFVTIPNWSEWNQSVDQIEANSEKRAAAGRLGGLNSGRSRQESKQNEASASSKTKQGLQAKRSKGLNPETETETETETSISRTRRKKPETPAPETFEITTQLKDWTSKNGFGGMDLESLTQAFLDHHASKGNTFVDWNRAWQTWIRNRATWDKDKTPQSSVSGTVPYVPMFKTEEEREAFYAEASIGDKVDLDG